MIRALFEIIFTPKTAWDNLQRDEYRQYYLLPLLVTPLLILAALSAFIPCFYQFITLSEAVKEALVIFFKYSASLLCGSLSIILLAKYYFASDISKKHLNIFIGYTFVIWLLTIIVGNILPSKFSFVQFAPIYIIWVVYQARDFLKIPSENILSYTVVSSVLIIGLPFLWDKIFGIILH